jgi:PAS domain S-box-containing protein
MMVFFMENNNNMTDRSIFDEQDLSKFTDSYASFNRIINSLQRKYIDLQGEFSNQNDELATSNKRLVELTKNNIAVTEFLNNLLSSITAGVIAVNNKGIITHFNPAASAIFELPINDPIGKKYGEIIPSGMPDKVNAITTLQNEHEVDSVEKKIELIDGGTIYLSVSTALIRDTENNIVGAAEVFQDLTKIKKMEVELARLNTLAALGEMAATIAHEVRNPLAAIAGFASLLERDMNIEDPKRKLIEKIKKGTDNLNHTVETLLNYTRYDEINKVDVDYYEFVQATIEQFKNDNPTRLENVHFNLGKTEKKGFNIKIDKMLYRQIFFNVFANAIEAFESNGTINISINKLPRLTALTKYSGKLMLGMHETILETNITDDGPGIPEDKMDKIFAPFFTTKSNGNGLGLAVAWKIIKAHGGEIVVDKNATQGAVFHLLMPIRINSVNGVSK